MSSLPLPKLSALLKEQASLSSQILSLTASLLAARKQERWFFKKNSRDLILILFPFHTGAFHVFVRVDFRLLVRGCNVCVGGWAGFIMPKAMLACLSVCLSDFTWHKSVPGPLSEGEGEERAPPKEESCLWELNKTNKLAWECCRQTADKKPVVPESLETLE